MDRYSASLLLNSLIWPISFRVKKVWHLSSFQGADNKEYSSMLHKALEGAVMLHTFPKTTVDVFALVLESGGSMILS